MAPAEQAGLAAVEKAFEGKVNAARTADKATMQLTISKSRLLDEKADLAQLHASRAAWLFYQQAKAGQPAFTGLKVTTVQSDTTRTYDFTLAQLAVVEKKLAAIEQAAGYLIGGDFNSLYALFDPTVMGVSDVEDLKGYCTQIEPEYGKPLAFTFEGFTFFKLSGQEQEQLHLAGHLKRDIKDTALSLFVDHTKPDVKGSVTSIKFDY